MASGYGKKFDQVVQALKEHCPLSSPVQIRTHSMTKHKLCGSCTAYSENGKIFKFLIELDNRMPVMMAIDTLIHEWAHAMDKEINGIPTEPHRNSWGICYAKAWRAYLSLDDDVY